MHTYTQTVFGGSGLYRISTYIHKKHMYVYGIRQILASRMATHTMKPKHMVIVACCSVLQCVAVRWEACYVMVRCAQHTRKWQMHNDKSHRNVNMMQHLHCSTLQRTATYCNILQHTGIYVPAHVPYSTPLGRRGKWQGDTASCNTAHCNILQYTATYCNTLQYIDMFATLLFSTPLGR